MSSGNAVNLRFVFHTNGNQMTMITYYYIYLHSSIKKKNNCGLVSSWYSIPTIVTLAEF